MKLAELCTLGVGGPARRLVEAHDEARLAQEAEDARARGEDLLLLGGGSNVVVADEGFDGLALLVRTRGLRRVPSGSDEIWTVEAGEPWPELVDRTVDEGLSGLECLAGIPGRAGAAPIQNLGAYGVEVADRLVELRVRDLVQRKTLTLAPGECAFRYRGSLFKDANASFQPRFLVLSLALRLSRGAPAHPRHAELAARLEALPRPTPRHLRDAVMELRRAKGMLLEGPGAGLRSVGSFFVNPVVEADLAARIRDAVPADPCPAWTLGQGRVKLAAAWMIEKSGFPRGFRAGRVGLSPFHALALVNHGDAAASEVLALARSIQEAVLARFGVALEMEPTLVGF